MKRIFLITGILCILAAIVLLGVSVYAPHRAEQRAASYVNTIRTITPEPQGAVLDGQREPAMPALSIDDTDFVGILEMPAYESALPVCSQWDSPSKYPCRFDGSIYDGSIIIGATTQKGQYDFYRDISVGDQVYFTDMRGKRYSYAVADIQYEKHADQSVLKRDDAALTLFLKNIYGFEYIVIFCESLK